MKATDVKAKRTKKAIFSEEENTFLLQELGPLYSIITQTAKTAQVCKKKKAAWVTITHAVNAIGGRGRCVEAVKKRWKDMRDEVKHRKNSQKKTGGGLPETPAH